MSLTRDGTFFAKPPVFVKYIYNDVLDPDVNAASITVYGVQGYALRSSLDCYGLSRFDELVYTTDKGVARYMDSAESNTLRLDAQKPYVDYDDSGYRWVRMSFRRNPLGVNLANREYRGGYSANFDLQDYESPANDSIVLRPPTPPSYSKPTCDVRNLMASIHPRQLATCNGGVQSITVLAGGIGFLALGEYKQATTCNFTLQAPAGYTISLKIVCMDIAKQ